MNIYSLQTEEPFYFFWDTSQCGFIQQKNKIFKCPGHKMSQMHTQGTDGYAGVTAAMQLDGVLYG